jgi:hypothetical protein
MDSERISLCLLHRLADLLLGQDKPDRSHISQAKGLTEPNTNKWTAASEWKLFFSWQSQPVTLHGKFPSLWCGSLPAHLVQGSSIYEEE